MKTLLHGHKAMGVLTQGHRGLLSQAKSSQANCYLLYFILLTSPDNKISDATKKSIDVCIFTGVQVGTPQQQAPFTAGPKRLRE